MKNNLRGRRTSNSLFTLFLPSKAPALDSYAPGGGDAVARAVRYALDRLEPRVYLSAARIGTIPTSITSTVGVQTLLAPGQTQLSIAHNATGAAARYFAFTLDGPNSPETVSFNLAPTTPSATSDAGLALYDGNGNLLAQADADAVVTNPGQETLTANLVNDRTYILATDFGPAGPPVDFGLTVQTDVQTTNTPLNVNPATGGATYLANTGDDAFNSPRDVDYYPISFLNSGSSGTVTVTPQGTGVTAAVTLFRRDDATQPWTVVNSGSDATGAAVSVSATPSAGKSLTDSQFMLAVAPQGYAGAAGAYLVAVSSANEIGPAVLTSATLTDLGTLAPVSLGVAGVDTVGSLQFGGGGEADYAFRSPTTGTVTLTVTPSSSFQGTIQLYSGDGSVLQAVVSNTTGGGAATTLTFQATANTQYRVRVGDVGNDQGGGFALSIRSPYSPTNLQLTGSVTTVAGIALDASKSGTFYHLTNVTGTTVLVIGLDPGASASATVTLSGPGIGTVTQTVAAGQKLFLPVNVATKTAALDLYVGATAGVGVGTLTLGQLAIPATINPTGYAGKLLNLTTPTVATGATSGFGTSYGFKYYSLIGTTNTTITATGAAGSSTVIARYEEDNGVMRLLDVQPVTGAGGSTTTLSTLTHNETLETLVAYQAGFTVGGAAQLSVTPPAPQPVGVGTVPDLTNLAQSIFQVRSVTLKADYQQHLWSTTIPVNATGTPVVNFTPDAGSGSLQVTVTAYFSTDLSTPIASATNVAGQQVAFALPGVAATYNGKTIVLRVVPIVAKVGEGTYTLKMTEATPNETTYLFDSNPWYLFGVAHPVGAHALPTAAITDIDQTVNGDGTAFGQFTSSVADSNGSMQVYRFWATSPGQVDVQTKDLDASANTTIQIYQPHFAASGNMDYLVPVANGSPDLDWFPADRSAIDSRIHYNNFASLAYPTTNAGSAAYNNGGGEYFVIVRNEQGTLGHYQISVDTPAFQPLSGLVAAGSTYQTAQTGNSNYMPTNGASLVLKLPFLTDTTANKFVTDFMGYYEIQLPSFHSSTLTVTSSDQSLFSDMQVFDPSLAGLQLASSVTQVSQHTVGTFTVLPGARTIYLRAHESGFAGDKNTTLTVAAPGSAPAGTVAPPATTAGFPAFSRVNMLTMSPTGAAASSVTAPMPTGFIGDAYTFEATDGDFNFSLFPSDPAGAALTYGVYVDGNLLYWNQTQSSGSSFVNGTTGGTFTMPTVRQPIAQDATTENQHYHEVTIYVLPVGAVTANSTYNLTVGEGRPLPLVNDILTFTPSVIATATEAGSTDASIWHQLVVPDKISGAVTMTVTFPAATFGTLPIRYDLYDASGTFITTQTFSAAANATTATFDLTPYVHGGQAYFLRVGEAFKANQGVTFKVTTTLSKSFINVFNPSQDAAKPPTTATIDPALNYSEPPPSGGFTFARSITTGTLVAGSKFWVGAAGVATFHVVTSDNSGNAATFNPYFALYRGQGSGNEFITYGLNLVDFVNNIDVNADGSYDLSAYVTPGMYAFELVRKDSSVVGAFSNITAQLPAATPIDLIVDPSSGIATPPTQAIDDSFGSASSLSQYRTTYYHVVTPFGSQDYFTATAHNNNTVLSGNADVTVWDQNSLGQYQGAYIAPDPVISVNHIPQQQGVDDLDATVQANPLATPGKDFYVGIYRNGLGSEIQTSPDFSVPQSGTPDLVVQSVTLTPNKGQTHVEVVVANHGFGTAPTSHAKLTFVDNTDPNNPITIDSQRFENALGAFGQRTYEFDWTPKNPTDTVTYVTNVNKDFPEINFGNNAQTVVLSTVDASRPTILLALADPALDGNPDVGIWGRYLQGVDLLTDVVITSHDGDGDNTLNIVLGSYPVTTPSAKSLVGLTNVFDGQTTNLIKNVNFGDFLPTAADNPNIYRMQVQDVWGLWSTEVSKSVQVVAHPGWLSGPLDTITFNTKTKKYDYSFDNKVVDLEGTINSLIGGDFPMIGKDANAFYVEATTHGSATLNPNDPISSPVDVHVFLEVLGDVLYDHHYGQNEIADNIKVSTNLQINRLTVDASSLNLTVAIQHYSLLSWASPKIPLFSYGIPGIASIDANLSFTVDAFLDAALTIALDPSILQSPQLPSLLGIASPTFIGPELDLGAKLEGDVEILGFDLASIAGTVVFKLNADLGLTTPHDQVVDLNNLGQSIGFGLDGNLFLKIEAKLLGFKIWGFSTPDIHLFHAGADVVTSAAPNYEELIDGNAAVGTIDLDATPNILIDPTTGKGLYLQLLDTNPADGATVGNLAFGTRASSAAAWSPLTTLSSPNHDNNLVSSWTHDGANAPAVAVYQATNFTGAPETATRNAFLTAQDLRYRYWNGTAWGPEQSITNDNLYDFNHALAFNNAGDGVLAWVHNGTSTPLDSNGALDRTTDEVQVSVWNKVTHTWTTPLQLTNNAVADTNPAVYADENGKLYVTWLQDTANGGNQIMYATYTGGAWTTAAVLPTNGLVPGGKIGELAFGSSGPGTVNLLFNDVLSTPAANGLPGQAAISKLFSRPTTLANFTSPTNVQTVAQDSNFSHIRTTKAPDGTLVAYWQQGNGATNEVFATKLTASANQQNWATPTPITSGGGLQFNPSLAIDTDGTYQLVYQPGDVGTPGAPSHDVPVGVPFGAGVATSSVKLLPELSFSNGLHFINQATAQSGLVLDGMATLVNTGLKGDNVEIDYFDGTPGAGGTQIGTQTIFLASGASFDIHHNYTILGGSQVYAIQVKALGAGGEAVTTADDVTTTTLSGLADLSIDSVTLSNPAAKAGQTVNVQVVVRNDSDIAITAPFNVSLDNGDPISTPGANVGVQQVASIGAGRTVTLTFAYTIPASGGDLTLMATVDSTKVITEGNENNNTAPLDLDLRADAAVKAAVDTGFSVQATQLNASGVNNVQVSATVANLGQVDLTNLDVHLYYALDSGALVDVGHQVIPSLLVGGSLPITFLTKGLAGVNHYRVVVDPTNAIADLNPADNTGQTALSIEGLPDLTIGSVVYNPLPLAQAQAVAARVTINNLGIAAADNFTLEVFDGSPAIGTLLGTVTVSHIDALSSLVVNLPFDTTNLVGSHSLTFVVDRGDDVLELSELNNTLASRVTFLPKTHVADRNVFYNNSKFDGSDPTANAADDGAVATDKVALLPGVTADFTSYTSYSKGINGIMVDISNLPGTPTFGDFTFKVGSTSSLTSYTTAPKPLSITVRKGAGTLGSDRVTIIWADNAIQKQWLQVTVLATTNTGLATPDVFYFGNAIAESGGGRSGDTTVDASDEINARNNQTGILNPPPITNLYDYNRDGFVDATDQILARNNQTGILTKLQLITAPVTGTGGAVPVSTVVPVPITTPPARTTTRPTPDAVVVAAPVAVPVVATPPVPAPAVVAAPVAATPVTPLPAPATRAVVKPTIVATPAAVATVVTPVPVAKPAARKITRPARKTVPAVAKATVFSRQPIPAAVVPASTASTAVAPKRATWLAPAATADWLSDASTRVWQMRKES